MFANTHGMPFNRHEGAFCNIKFTRNLILLNTIIRQSPGFISLNNHCDIHILLTCQNRDTYNQISTIANIDSNLFIDRLMTNVWREII